MTLERLCSGKVLNSCSCIFEKSRQIFGQLGRKESCLVFKKEQYYRTPAAQRRTERERAKKKIHRTTRTSQLLTAFQQLHIVSLNTMTNNYGIFITTYDDEHEEWSIELAFACRMVIYVAIMALLVMIVILVIKLLGHCDGDYRIARPTVARAAPETNRLLSKEVVQFNYGTCEGDVESGEWVSSSSEDLYDGKICVICYDKQRNCFFIPCGHCATCNICAQRITQEETKNCPVCRRCIHKVRKLFVS